MSVKVSSSSIGEPMIFVRKRIQEANLQKPSLQNPSLPKPSLRTRAVAFAIAASIGVCGGLIPEAARSDDPVVTGVLGSYTSGVWPFLIGMQKGLFAHRNIK